MTDYIDFRYFIGFAGLVSTIGCLYFAYKNDKTAVKNQKDGDEINKDNVNAMLEKHERKPHRQSGSSP